MKYLVIGLILLVSGCAPFNVRLALYESNNYVLADGQSPSNIVQNTSNEARAYGCNNHVIIEQSNVMYKSPMTNSSNSVPITLPLMGY